MRDIAVQVEGLGKQYHIGRQQAGYETIRESLTRTVLSPFRKTGRILRGQATAASGLDETIWALRDVSFDVQHGEVLGIIGQNGAGKSTLLKILSRITEPTVGYADVYGRVGSLLEVGTGFHHELTGRENIYLNGAILGMNRAEIARKFDEIVAFAEVEKFIDTPVKHYSSGMYLRLAFAVAAHLEPEILVVDEVLAVGDAAFQKKCLGKMGDVAREGRTVLFVSHNMVAVRNLCGRTIWLQDGRIYQTGETTAVTERYLRNSLRSEIREDIQSLIAKLPADPAFRLIAVEIQQDGQIGDVVVNGRPVEVKIRYQVLKRTTGLRVYFDLLDEQDTLLVRSFHDEDAPAIPTVDAGEYISSATIPANLLAPRRYEVRIRAGIFNVRSCTGDGLGIPITVEASSKVNRGYPHDTIRSKLQPIIPWQTRQTSRP
ncbi:MAG: ATP-binding cassette domain-containing protein [Chloroflexi bacterium]|nr:ATP-binding cassette domain-containing protein [Chloroflexota bacterium]